MGLMRGLLITVAWLLSCMAASYALNQAGVPLSPLLINLVFYAGLLALPIAGLIRRDWLMALAPAAFLAAWAAISEGHAQLLMARAGPELGAQALPPLGSIDTLSVAGRGGLNVNAARTGGVSSLMEWECRSWCASALRQGKVRTLVLRERPGPDLKAFRAFRLASGAACASADTEATARQRQLTKDANATPDCITSEARDSLPDGIHLNMIQQTGLVGAGSLCCQSARFTRVEAGGETELAHWRMGNATTVLPLPVILSGLAGGSGVTAHFMARDVPLGTPYWFDGALDAVLSAPVTWRN